MMIDTLILGCTDFTCIAQELRVVLSPSIRIVDPAGEVVKTANMALQERNWRQTGRVIGTMTFYASGEAPAGAKDFARRIFDIYIDEFRLVSLK